jgi:uncharacterized membrane protein
MLLSHILLPTVQHSKYSLSINIFFLSILDTKGFHENVPSMLMSTPAKWIEIGLIEVEMEIAFCLLYDPFNC